MSDFKKFQMQDGVLLTDTSESEMSEEESTESEISEQEFSEEEEEIEEEQEFSGSEMSEQEFSEEEQEQEELAGDLQELESQRALFFQCCIDNNIGTLNTLLKLLKDLELQHPNLIKEIDTVS